MNSENVIKLDDGDSLASSIISTHETDEDLKQSDSTLVDAVEEVEEEEPVVEPEDQVSTRHVSFVDPEEYYTVDERKKIGVTIKNYFSTMLIEDGKACMTNSKTLHKYVADSKLLGYGVYGTVYRATIPNTNVSLAIKEGKISPKQYKKALKKKYPMEYLYNKLINDLIDDLICPNFIYSYIIFFCDKCSIISEKKITTQCSETMVELFSATLDDLGTGYRTREVMESLFCQVLFALASIQLKYGMHHNDVKQDNILIKVISEEGGYWTYHLDNEVYYVPNYGYIAALNDFGISKSFMPGISQDNYGQRQAKVVLGSNGEYYFEPFITERSPTAYKDLMHMLKDSYDLTQNIFYKNFDSQPSIPVDLQDFRSFPVSVFNADIMDLISTFIGGERALIPGRHPGIMPPEPREYFEKLFKDFYVVDEMLSWPIDGTHLFLASHAIRKLFPHFKKKVKGPCIETYTLSTSVQTFDSYSTDSSSVESEEDEYQAQSDPYGFYNSGGNNNEPDSDVPSSGSPDSDEPKPRWTYKPGGSSRGPSSDSSYYSVEDRKKLGTTIKNYFSSVTIEEGKTCMSESKTLQKYVTNSKILGQGSFGNVYKVTIPKTDISVAIKEGEIDKDQYTKAMKKQYPMEYLFNKLINDLIDDLVCPNFIYSYAIFFCDQCTLTIHDETHSTQCSETIVELFNGELDPEDIDLTDKVTESLLFQVFFAVASIQIKYGMFHNDIKQENILIKVIPEGGYWRYELDNEVYHVPNYGYIAALNDFGVSYTFKPGISQADYGYREAEVVSKGGKRYFKPFTTNTDNTFNSDIDIDDYDSSVPVDLNDFRRFPVREFNYDVVDVIRMLIGGSRTSQPGKHPGLTKSARFQNLEKYFILLSDEDAWPTNGVYLFLASHVIEKLFPFYTSVASEVDGPRIETYNL